MSRKMVLMSVLWAVCAVLLWCGRDGVRADDSKITPSADQLAAYQKALAMLNAAKDAETKAAAILQFTIQQMAETCEKHKLVLLNQTGEIVCGEATPEPSKGTK